MSAANRAELLRKLEGRNEIQENLALIGEVGQYLLHHPDPEMRARLETSFGSTIAELQFKLRGGDALDFADEFKGNCVWLRTYLELTRESESPGIYHALSALSIAAQLMSHEVYVDMGTYVIYPQLAIILVGPSGLKKNSAIAYASRMLKYAPDGRVKTLYDKFTPESLTAFLTSGEGAAVPNVFAQAPEMATAFGRAKYLEGMVPFFTRLLDNEGVGEMTQARGERRVEEVAFGFIAGTTPGWITSEMHVGVVSGGFTSRFLISYIEATPRLVYRAKKVDPSKLLAATEEVLMQLERVKGQIHLEPTADAFLEQWYHAHRLIAVKNEVMSGYENRKLSHIIRLAMIFAVLDGQRQIMVQHIQDAIAILDYLEPGMIKLFGMLARSKTATTSDHLLQIIRQSGKRSVSKRHLLRIAVLTLDIEQIEAALAFLHQAGVVEIVQARGDATITLKEAGKYD